MRVPGWMLCFLIRLILASWAAVLVAILVSGAVFVYRVREDRREAIL